MKEANRPDSADQDSVSRPKKRRHMLRKTLITLLLLLVALTLTVQYGLGFIVRNAARGAAPRLIGTSVEIKGAYVRPFFGIVEMSGMVVGPPEGFKANVFEMNNFRITVDPNSVFSDVIIIKEVAIINPVVSYELSGLRSNVGAIMEKLGSTKEKAEVKAEKKPGKKIVIEHFVFSGAKIRLASTMTGGKGIVIPMPAIELRDIGKKSGGVTGLEAFTQTMASICGGIIRAVKDGALALGSAASGAALNAASATIDTVGAAGGAAMGTAGSVGGAAVDTVGAAGGAALDAASAVGGAAVGGVRAVGGAIGGILGGGKDKPATTNAPAANSEAGDPSASKGGVVGGAKAVGGAAIGAVSAVGGAAVNTVGAVGGAALDGAAALGGAAVGGVKAVGGAAAGGVKAVGGAAADGVMAVGGAIGGIFSGSKDETSTTNTPATTSGKP